MKISVLLKQRQTRKVYDTWNGTATLHAFSGRIYRVDRVGVVLCACVCVCVLWWILPHQFLFKPLLLPFHLAQQTSCLTFRCFISCCTLARTAQLVRLGFSHLHLSEVPHSVVTSMSSNLIHEIAPLSSACHLFLR